METSMLSAATTATAPTAAPPTLPKAPPKPIRGHTVNDVLFGRGNGSNHHPGNKVFRKIIRDKKEAYSNARPGEKSSIAKSILHEVHQLGGRFLEKSSAVGLWEEVAEKKSLTKISQALRELPKKRIDEQTGEPQNRIETIEIKNPKLPKSFLPNGSSLHFNEAATGLHKISASHVGPCQGWKSMAHTTPPAPDPRRMAGGAMTANGYHAILPLPPSSSSPMKHPKRKKIYDKQMPHAEEDAPAVNPEAHDILSAAWGILKLVDQDNSTQGNGHPMYPSASHARIVSSGDKSSGGDGKVSAVNLAGDGPMGGAGLTGLNTEEQAEQTRAIALITEGTQLYMNNLRNAQKRLQDESMKLLHQQAAVEAAAQNAVANVPNVATKYTEDSLLCSEKSSDAKLASPQALDENDQPRKRLKLPTKENFKGQNDVNLEDVTASDSGKVKGDEGRSSPELVKEKGEKIISSTRLGDALNTEMSV